MENIFRKLLNSPAVRILLEETQVVPSAGVNWAAEDRPLRAQISLQRDGIGMGGGGEDFRTQIEKRNVETLDVSGLGQCRENVVLIPLSFSPCS